MPGELSLSALLAGLSITVDHKIFVFLTLPYDKAQTCPIPLDKLQMTFRESQGLTVIVEKAVAEAYGFSSNDYTFPSKQLTCQIHSSLEAVGFMAAMSRVLADEGIGCNPVSGYYHDHLFVPLDEADKAVKVLDELAKGARSIEGHASPADAR